MHEELTRRYGPIDVSKIKAERNRCWEKMDALNIQMNDMDDQLEKSQKHGAASDRKLAQMKDQLTSCKKEPVQLAQELKESQAMMEQLRKEAAKEGRGSGQVEGQGKGF